MEKNVSDIIDYYTNTKTKKYGITIRSRTRQKCGKLSGLNCATKVFNYLSVTDATDQTLADAKTINNKLQGRRSGKVSETPPTEGGTAPNTVSVSRQSYDMLTENFSALIDLVSSVPSYTPNET